MNDRVSTGEGWEFVAYGVNAREPGDERTTEELLRADYAMLVAWARSRGLKTSPIHYTHIERT